MSRRKRWLVPPSSTLALYVADLAENDNGITGVLVSVQFDDHCVALTLAELSTTDMGFWNRTSYTNCTSAILRQYRPPALQQQKSILLLPLPILLPNLNLSQNQRPYYRLRSPYPTPDASQRQKATYQMVAWRMVLWWRVAQC